MLRYTRHMVQKIGIFGGTFDPPHIAHLVLASEACAQLSLDRVLWVLTPMPPHKRSQSITETSHRIEMVRKTIKTDPHFELSTVELDRPGPQYAVDTVREIQRANPGAEMTYLFGEDSLRDILTWHDPGTFISYCHYLGVMRRPWVQFDLDDLEKHLPGLKKKTRWLECPLLEIASHDIRERIRDGRPFRYFLSEKVFEYIVENNLYGYKNYMNAYSPD